MERNMNREVETIREKVHTTADAALFLCFQEVKGAIPKEWSGCRCFIMTFRLRDTEKCCFGWTAFMTCSACRMQEAVCGAFQKGKKKSGNLQMKWRTIRIQRFQPEPSVWSVFRFSSDSTVVCRDFWSAENRKQVFVQHLKCCIYWKIVCRNRITEYGRKTQ